MEDEFQRNQIERINLSLVKELKMLSMLCIAVSFLMIWLKPQLVTIGQGVFASACLIIALCSSLVLKLGLDEERVKLFTLINYIALVGCGWLFFQSKFSDTFFSTSYDINLIFTSVFLLFWLGYIVVRLTLFKDNSGS